MRKLLRLIFTPYVEDDYAAYIHHGVGYSGTEYHRTPGRNTHKGVGYGGIYD
jgi:hypothetical protein